MHQLRRDVGVQLTDAKDQLTSDSQGSRREGARRLADTLLEDIELARVAPLDLARRAGRLARLLDDTAAMAWLQYEASGYPEVLDLAATRAAEQSGRRAPDTDGAAGWYTTSLGQLQLQLENSLNEFAGLSQSSAGGEWALAVETSRKTQRQTLRKNAAFHVNSSTGSLGRSTTMSLSVTMNSGSEPRSRVRLRCCELRLMALSQR